MSANELTFDKGRVATFNDAVIAIAITLLVLNVHSTLSGTVNNPEVWQEVKHLLPNLFGFAISFWVISRFWISNQLFFKSLKIIDMRTMQYNLLLLFVIAVLPFPTDLLASTHLTQATIGIYAGTVAVASLLQALL